MIYQNTFLEVENECLRARLKANKELAAAAITLLDLPDTNIGEVVNLLERIKN